jgi:hypothetical protein
MYAALAILGIEAEALTLTALSVFDEAAHQSGRELFHLAC